MQIFDTGANQGLGLALMKVGNPFGDGVQVVQNTSAHAVS